MKNLSHFTGKELFTMSQGIILMIGEVSKANCSVYTQEAKDAIQKELDYLQELNSKICDHAEAYEKPHISLKGRKA